MRISDWSSDVCSSDLRWEELLDKLVDYLGLISGVIIVSDPRHERRVTPFQSRFIREDARDMLQRFLAREDADDAPAYRAIQNLPLNRLYAEPEIFGCEGWENLPASAFRDFQRNVFGKLGRASGRERVCKYVSI